jgi:hypothetical protein
LRSGSRLWLVAAAGLCGLSVSGLCGLPVSGLRGLSVAWLCGLRRLCGLCGSAESTADSSTFTLFVHDCLDARNRTLTCGFGAVVNVGSPD